MDFPLKEPVKPPIPNFTMFLGPAMNTYRLLFGCAVALTAACGTPVSAAAEPAAWSSLNPLGIPYEIRMHQFNKGNLAPNASFERNDPAAGALTVEGWEQTGDRVEWVDRASGAAAEEVHHGLRAVKIQRDTAGELDLAEGVLSDFIAVIPGNYEFTYDVRLKQVDGNRRRWGARLGDVGLPAGALGDVGLDLEPAVQGARAVQVRIQHPVVVAPGVQGLPSPWPS